MGPCRHLALDLSLSFPFSLRYSSLGSLCTMCRLLIEFSVPCGVDSLRVDHLVPSAQAGNIMLLGAIIAFFYLALHIVEDTGEL
jgi:hypothetical protein